MVKLHPYKAIDTAMLELASLLDVILKCIILLLFGAVKINANQETCSERMITFSFPSK